jgi:8-amino-7-oxononanoate synthase
MLTDTALSFISRHLDSLREKSLYRQLKTLDGAQGPWTTLEGRPVLNLCSNNYLGLASHPAVREAAARAARELGCGSGASRLISGNFAWHETLESRLARFKSREATLLYSTGYMANVGAISALVGRDDYVFSDELNHASIIDGCRLSRARVVVYPHNDMDALEDKLRLACSGAPEAHRLLVVDGVFSMDGDIAPLPDLAELAERYGAMLMVDEAHATGVLGPEGRGVVAQYGLEGRVSVSMSTLSKSLGSFGAFVAGSRELRNFLVNTSRSFIFTTALPPSPVAAALAALDVLEADPGLPARVQNNADYLRAGL